jgi:anti-sigma regulatory factor (Ser/Thr protein kinase)
MVTTLPVVQAFRADGSALSEIRRWIEARTGEFDLGPTVSDDLAVAVTEACRDLLAHERSTFLYVSWWAHAGVVEIRVRDEGVLEQPPVIIDGDDGDAGLRFPYILAFVDEIDLRPGTRENPGTMIRLVKETSAA